MQPEKKQLNLNKITEALKSGVSTSNCKEINCKNCTTLIG